MFVLPGLLLGLCHRQGQESPTAFSVTEDAPIRKG